MAAARGEFNGRHDSIPGGRAPAAALLYNRAPGHTPRGRVRLHRNVENMNIAKDHVVVFHYRLRDEAGQLLEESHGGKPSAYLHGHGGLIAGLERAMSGRAKGDQFSVTVPPAEAYGERFGDARQRIAMKHVLTRGKLRPGQVIAVSTERGPRQVTVVKPGKFTVDIDTHHPLAGRTLSFEIEIVDVREATAEERAHGHAHSRTATTRTETAR